MDGLLNDLRYTFRTLRRDAGFATFAILIVGLGIGACSTLFSVVNGMLLRPLPFQSPDRLVWVVNHDSGGLSGATTQVNYLLDMRREAHSLSDVAGYFAFYGVGDTTLSGQGTPERLSGVPVTCNFLPVLGVQPVLGRNFNDEECKWRGPDAVILSYGFWQRRFAGDGSIVGRKLTLNDKPVSVIGVLPASFDFSSVFHPGSHIDLLSAFPLTPETNRWGNTMAIVARLHPGVSAGSANAEIRTLGRQLSAAHPEMNDLDGKVEPLSEHVRGRIRPALYVLAGAVGVVMLIVCANLSNLLLARTASRHKEIAIRTAVGAGRARLLRQMLTEGVALSSVGAALGVMLALAGTRAVAHLDSFNLPLLRDVHTDGAALGFTLLMAVGTGVVFGLAPALQVKATTLHDALKDTGRGSTEGKQRQWVRNALVVSEIAFACVLLVGAGLLIRSFLRVLDVNLGFHPESAAHVRVDPERRAGTTALQAAYFDDVLRRARAIPGVTAAGLSDALPLGRNRTWGAAVKGQQYAKGRFPIAYVRVVSDGYIGAMGIPLRAGRDFTPRDTAGSEMVMLINETMAKRLFPGQDPLGQIVMVNGGCRVVGVVEDVRHLALEESSGMEMYIAIRQTGDYSSADLVIRSSLPPAQMASAVRGALAPVVPTIMGAEFRPLQQLVDKAVSPRRFVVMLLGGFAVFALLLASLGIYGVISYSVGQRTQEIGIRMALGASAGNLQAGIIWQTLALAGVGMLIGTTAAWLGARLLTGMLYGVKAGDPVTFLGMVAVLVVVAAIAGYLPARRASRIDPSVALRAN